MQLATINGVTLRYEVLGNKGPWMALSPGGRREMDNVRPLAQKMAAAGYRVWIHDRRNCGASEVAFDASQPEYEIWADDLAELLKRLNATPVIVGGGSSGARLAILYALNYASRVKALLIWRVTGGPFAVKRLAENYYGQYIRAAEQGGMAAVADAVVERYLHADYRAKHPEVAAGLRERLVRTDPRGYVAACHAVANVDWLDRLTGVRLPTLVLAGARDAGATPEMAKAIAERIAGAELRVFADASHLSVVEAGDEFHAAVSSFLASLPSR